MNKNEILRENLLALMTGEAARMPFQEVFKEFPTEKINENFPKSDYSAWFLLEHLRIAQEDILDFIKNPEYKARNWPKDYWPAKGKQATPAIWKKSIEAFTKDFEELMGMIRNPETDLYKKVPWGDGEIFLREIITVSNHNAFHLGEFAMARQMMGTWNKSHKA